VRKYSRFIALFVRVICEPYRNLFTTQQDCITERTLAKTLSGICFRLAMANLASVCECCRLVFSSPMTLGTHQLTENHGLAASGCKPFYGAHHCLLCWKGFKSEADLNAHYADEEHEQRGLAQNVRAMWTPQGAGMATMPRAAVPDLAPPPPPSIPSLSQSMSSGQFLGQSYDQPIPHSMTPSNQPYSQSIPLSIPRPNQSYGESIPLSIQPSNTAYSQSIPLSIPPTNQSLGHSSGNFR
jgi:hypothetical protein